MPKPDPASTPSSLSSLLFRSTPSSSSFFERLASASFNSSGSTPLGPEIDLSFELDEDLALNGDRDPELDDDDDDDDDPELDADEEPDPDEEDDSVLDPDDSSSFFFVPPIKIITKLFQFVIKIIP